MICKYNIARDGNVIKPFHATGLCLHLLKTSGNQRFSGGIERDQSHEMGHSVDKKAFV